MRTEWGKSAAFTMRSFRFTTTGTSGDNSNQQQQISCDVKMIPAGSTPFGSGGPNCPWPNDCEVEYRLYGGLSSGSPSYNKLHNAQMPDCDCYTPDECEANRSDFSARKYCETDESDADQSILCDDRQNMCHILSLGEYEKSRGVCENCLNLKSAQDCQERD